MRNAASKLLLGCFILCVVAYVVKYIINLFIKPVFQNPFEHIVTIISVVIVSIILFFWKIAPNLNFQSHGIAYIVLGSAICMATYYREFIYNRYFYTPPVIVEYRYAPTPIPTQRYVPTPTPSKPISNGIIQAIRFRFFYKESDGERVYDSEFPSNTNAIYWELDYTSSNVVSTQISIFVVWKVDGNVYTKYPLHVLLKPGEEIGHLSTGGNGPFSIGQYEVDLYCEGAQITHGEFEVY